MQFSTSDTGPGELLDEERDLVEELDELVLVVTWEVEPVAHGVSSASASKARMAGAMWAMIDAMSAGS